jgi:hypothetical protein
MVGIVDMADWSDYVPLVQRTINSAVNRTTGLAPAKLLYGNAIDLNRMLLNPPVDTGPQVTYHQYLQDMLAAQTTLTEAALERQRVVVEARLAKAPANPTTFAVGSYVLVQPKGVPGIKYDVKWWGPYVVTEQRHESYYCQDLNTHQIFQFTADRLKPYREDIQVPAPKVALWGAREYEVERIISHTLGPTAAKCTFKVRWLGYGPDDDSILKTVSVKNLKVFREYIREQNLPVRLFPRDKYPLLD